MAEIYLWTGQGWGKSTSAFGTAIRAAGHGFKVEIIQFMKGREYIGEYKFFKKTKNITMKQFGREHWVNLEKPSQKDKQLAQKGLQYAKKTLQKEPFLLILDEINIAVKIGLLKEEDVLDFLDNIPKKTHLYLTGRYASKKLKEKADYINKIKMIKGPKKLEGEKGIDY